MKKLSIETGKLKEALSIIGPVVNSKTVLPVLTNILCRAKDNVIEFIGSDMEITMITSAPCTCTEELQFLLSYNHISKILALHHEDLVNIEVKAKSLKISGVKDEYDIRNNSKMEDFPKLPEISKSKTFEIESTSTRWLRVALETTGKNEKYPFFSYVLLQLKKEGATIASSDGSYCLFFYKLPNVSQHEIELLIPTKIIKAFSGHQNLAIAWNESFFSLKNENVTAIVTMSQYKYPDVRKVIPEGKETNLTVQRSSLTDAFLKCSLSEAIQKDTSLSLKPALIDFKTQDQVFKINVQIPGEYTGEVTDISVLSDKALKLLQQVDFGELKLCIYDKTKGIMIRTDEDPNYTAILNPLVSTSN